MKNLKVLILALFAALAGLSSCENLGLSPSESSDDSAFVDFMFLATADSSSSSGKHGHGKKHNMTEIELSALPTSVTGYITTNYVGSTIKRAAQSDSGKYAVHIVLADSTHKGLLFDAAGVFVKEFAGKGHGGEKIDVATLPAAITTYISTTYAGSTVSGARKSSDGKYGVLVTKADGTKIMLGFDAAGVFLNELSMKGKGGKGKGKGK
ncbi:MAG TPA: hypothetical protein VK175_13220 [Leadbetterella sp.]|nr:hypothetical protein [Leadbetterella sp.]